MNSNNFSVANRIDPAMDTISPATSAVSRRYTSLVDLVKSLPSNYTCKSYTDTFFYFPTFWNQQFQRGVADG
jgi:hypothetical protein